MSERRLSAVAPELARILADGALHPASAIQRETVFVGMRDGVRLATDLYRPPDAGRAPAVAVRTPYGRESFSHAMTALAQQGYVGISQDCRGTGESEPDHWDFYVYESEDSLDFVEWITQQEWFDGFLGSMGSSYAAGTQWCMAMHPAMGAIVPVVGGLGVVPTTRPRLYMFVNAYSRSIGKGAEKAALTAEEMERGMASETLAGGYFNDPLHTRFSEAVLDRYPELRSLPPGKAQRRLYEKYSTLPAAERADLIKLALDVESVTFASVEALPAVFGQGVTHDAHLLPRVSEAELVRSLRAPSLLITAWYDWALDDALATWDLLTHEGAEPVRSRSRLLIKPSAHNMPGYREGRQDHPELDRIYGFAALLEAYWFRAVREEALDSWPTVIYYLMGANEWRSAPAWPPPEAEIQQLYLAAGRQLTSSPPGTPSEPDRYAYDPDDPTPTVGGSIVSYVYSPGSVDVSDVQARPDLLTYTSEVLERDLDVVGPLRLVLYASSSALDTDFSARLSDVFPDGRAIQLQSGTLRTRYRNPLGAPEPLKPGRIYRLEIDMSATATRFAAGHRLRLDLASADFPRFDRNTNRGGEPGPPIVAEQTVHHDADHPSHLLLSVLGDSSGDR